MRDCDSTSSCFGLIIILILINAFVIGFNSSFKSEIPIVKIWLIIQTLILLCYIMRSTILRIIRDYAGWVSFIVVTLLITYLVYLAKSSLGEQNPVTTSLSLKRYIISIVDNVLGVLIGIWGVFLVLKPRLKIYSILAIMSDDSGKILVKNTNLTDLYDVKITLECCYKEGNGVVKTFPIEFAEDATEIPILRNRLYTNECDHAWQTKDSIKDMIAISDYLRCRVVATHSLSGIHFVTEQKFKNSDCLKGDYNNNDKFIPQ